MPDEPIRQNFTIDDKPIDPGGLVAMACDCGHPSCISMRLGVYGGTLMDLPATPLEEHGKTAVVVSLNAVKAIGIARGILELAQQQLEKQFTKPQQGGS